MNCWAIILEVKIANVNFRRRSTHHEFIQPSVFNEDMNTDRNTKCDWIHSQTSFFCVVSSSRRFIGNQSDTDGVFIQKANTMCKCNPHLLYNVALKQTTCPLSVYHLLIENQIFSFKPQEAIKPSSFLLLFMIPSLTSSWRWLRPCDPDHLFICLSSQRFTCQWKVQASGRLLSLYFCILLINHSFHIMFRLRIGGEMLTLRQILSYLTSTWTFSIQNSPFFPIPAEFHWISLCRAHKANFFSCHCSECLSVYSSNLTCFEKQYQNRTYTTVFSLPLTFFFLKDQTEDLTDFSPRMLSVNHKPLWICLCSWFYRDGLYKPQAPRLIMKFVP